jgi:phenylalanyl-tRNA synthetase beta chain
VPTAVLTPKQARTALARRVLAARGMLECVTFSFVDHATAALFGGTSEAIQLVNPIAADLDQMRPTPLATLALAAARNAARGMPDLAIFEIGPSYAPDCTQRLTAAGLFCGQTPLSALSPARRLDAMDAKAAVLAVLSALGAPLDAITTAAGAGSHYHPGQSGTLTQGPKTVLAAFGALHPSVCARLDLAPGTAAFEIFLDNLAEPKRRKKAAPTLPAFQPLRRDFAFIVNETTPAEAVLRAAKGAERQFITGVALFDRYQGKGVPEGQVSLAVAVTIQPTDRTLTEAELDAISEKIVAEVGKKTGGSLRGK